jgi:hypothetical protein
MVAAAERRAALVQSRNLKGRLELLEIGCAEGAAALEKARRQGDRNAKTRLLAALCRLELERNRISAAEALLVQLEGGRASHPRLAAEVAWRSYDSEAALEAARRELKREGIGRPALAAAHRLEARALLGLGRGAQALAAARRGLEIEWRNPLGRALEAHAARRVRLDRSLEGVELVERLTGRHRVITDLGPEVADRLCQRLSRLEPAFERLVDVPDLPVVRAGHRTTVFVLSEECFASIAPAAGARGFYNRDERAVFAAGSRIIEAERLIAHEALHAHLHRLIDDPPAWLDEGLADYAATYPPVKAGSAPVPHPIRLRDVKVLAGQGHRTALVELAGLSRARLYADEGLRERFPWAWGYVYFLRHGADGAYRRSFDAYLDRILRGGSANEAYDAAFGPLDPEALDAACLTFLQALRD